MLKENRDQDTRLDGGRGLKGNAGSNIELADASLIQSKFKQGIITLMSLTFLSLIANDSKSLIGGVHTGNYQTGSGNIRNGINASFIPEAAGMPVNAR